MHPFLNQNQGYYVFIHEDNSPTEVPADFSGTGGADGLEWDEEVGEENIPEREDDAWASLYRFLFIYIIFLFINIKIHLFLFACNGFSDGMHKC